MGKSSWFWGGCQCLFSKSNNGFVVMGWNLIRQGFIKTPILTGNSEARKVLQQFMNGLDAPWQLPLGCCKGLLVVQQVLLQLLLPNFRKAIKVGNANKVSTQNDNMSAMHFIL